ncbi:choloylglycine hydrolase [Photobacterium jeanii]|uniref:Choloylglycine hydrolase n=1 Tax=Photobacterium jeanii TaxID=858640 RepID=A0A178K0Y5_9GAMM|nr:linear amide C-N hydrolase [Photobacterium jeanii]OAN10989.1 choloylglycine hydrolase [Photobacterium jeanii]PST90503.1 linear amide C-N hydrolase [Photobacterium jeanii]
MKTFKLNKMAAIALTAASIATVSGAANACSRITMDTPHGVSTVRSLDWGQQLGNVSEVHPVGLARSSKATPSYKHQAEWKTKYHTVTQVEKEVFVDTSADSMNTEGLAASLLYMYDSAKFIKDYKDTGAPAVNFGDITTFIAENYKTVDEAVSAFNNNEWQIAWVDGIHGTQHGLHLSIQDKSGDIALFQLNEGGKMVVHRGDTASDLRVMANAPLQQDHREYVSKVDLSNLKADKVPSSISSKDRNLRGLFYTSHIHLDKDKSWAQTRGKLLSTFNAGNLVPQDLIDPVNGETYATWTQFAYNQVSGDFHFTNWDTMTSIEYNINDTVNFDAKMCADLVKQANAGEKHVTWTACE